MSVIVHPNFQRNLGDVFGSNLNQTLAKPLIPEVTGGAVLRVGALVLIGAFLLRSTVNAFSGKKNS